MAANTYQWIQRESAELRFLQRRMLRPLTIKSFAPQHCTTKHTSFYIAPDIHVHDGRTQVALSTRS